MCRSCRHRRESHAPEKKATNPTIQTDSFYDESIAIVTINADYSPQGIVATARLDLPSGADSLTLPYLKHAETPPTVGPKHNDLTSTVCTLYISMYSLY